MDAHQWQVVELQFLARQACSEPLAGWRVTVTFTGPHGESTAIPAFCDGGRQWKARFLPSRPGPWQWRTSCDAGPASGLDALAGAFTAQAPAADEVNPLWRHGGILQVAADRRSLTYTDGTPFFWLGDTWWFCPSALVPIRGSSNPAIASAYRHLVELRAAQGYSVVHMAFLGDSGVNGAYSAMFAGELVPAYWREVDRYLELANRHGIIPVIGFGFHQGLNTPTLEQLQRLWRYVLARYGAMGVSFLICGEYNQAGGKAPQTQQAVLSPADSARIPKMLELGQFIKANDPWHRAMTVHPWWFGGEKREAWSCDWYDFIMLQGGHGKDGPPPAFYRDIVAQVPHKPLLEGECTYEGIFSFSDAVVRRNAYKAIQCGSFGYTYGSQGLWYPNQSAADTKFSDWGPTVPWWEAAARPGARQLGHLRRIYESVDWWRLRPLGADTIRGGGAAPGGDTPWGKADGQGCYVIYFPSGTGDGPAWELTGAKGGANYQFRWRNPRTGSATGEPLKLCARPDGTLLLPPCPDADDWVLVLSAP